MVHPDSCYQDDDFTIVNEDHDSETNHYNYYSYNHTSSVQDVEACHDDTQAYNDSCFYNNMTDYNKI